MKNIRIIETGMGEEFSERIWTHKMDSTESTVTLDGAYHQVSPPVQGDVEFEGGDDGTRQLDAPPWRFKLNSTVLVSYERAVRWPSTSFFRSV